MGFLSLNFGRQTHMKNNNYTGQLTIAAGQNIKERDYWLNQFSDFTGKSIFPYDNAALGKEIKTLEFKLSPDLFTRISGMSKGSDYRIHMILVTGIVLLLHKYTYPGNGDITMGIPTYKQEVQGELINTVLAVRNRLNPGMTFKELLLQVSRAIFQANEHQNYPIETLLYKLNMPKPGNDIPLFDVAVLLETIHDRNYLKDIQPNMVFIFRKSAENLHGTLEYNALLYKKSTSERITRHLDNMLQNALNDIDSPLSGIGIVTEEEKNRLLIEFNGNQADIPWEKTICRLIEEHAGTNPDNIAVVGPHQLCEITYAELNQRSNQLAYWLKEKGVQTDAIVGISMNRSIEMAVSILATWKAGGAYMPIDPDYPQERVQYLLKDSGTKILLTDTGIPGKLKELSINNLQLKQANLAYLIYTSGSTGKPKGVMVEHMGMMNHIAAKIADLQLTGESIIVQNAAQTFDISVWQFFAALTVGGKTVIFPDELIMEPDHFITRLEKDQVTILELVPSYLSLLLDIQEEHYTRAVSFALQYLLVTGEEIKPELVRRWFERYPGIKMVNAYGPTEASDDITHHIMHEAPAKGIERIPIGKTVQNFKIYVLDQHHQLSPLGVKGEICVTGIGVGRGYLNKPGLTAQKFQPNEKLLRGVQGGGFLEKSPPGRRRQKLYKTGDLGRWLPDGILEFFGRKDFQVKIRGFRIELGEIENRLAKHQSVKECAVTAREDENGNKYLCAYVVARGAYTPALLKEYLSTQIPEYMVPAQFVQMKAMPLMSSGKIDRKSLPTPGIDRQPEIPYIEAAMLNRAKELAGPGQSHDMENVIEKNQGREYTLSAEDRQRILVEFNANQISYPQEKTLHQLFQEQAEKNPDYTAVVGLSEGTRGLAPLPVTMSITYKELDQKSDQQAHLLRERGVKPETIVGIQVENSIAMVIGVLSILKSGAAYLPIGVDYPEERVQYMLKDSNAKILVSKENQVIKVKEELQLSPLLRNSPLERGVCKADGVCHIIYTSGSTGQPKGTMAEHRQVHNAVLGLRHRIYKQYHENCRYALLIPFYFDGYIKQAFGALLYGQCLYIAPEDIRFNGEELWKFYQKNQIHLSDGTPTHIRLLSASSENIAFLTVLKHFLIAGDVLPKHVAELFFDIFTKAGKTPPKITNLYGPTEACVDSTSYEVTAQNIGKWDKIPIGKSMPNEQVYILDKGGSPVPVGVVGELCIAGDCITRGYLNHPELTAERFCLRRPGGALVEKTAPTGPPCKNFLLNRSCRSHMSYISYMSYYRTGDLARWLPDGNIEFISRKDHQIQILGVRIEPQEIESVLMTYPEIKEAVVVAREREQGEKYPCALVVSPKRLKQQEIREYLEGKLPDYMIPPVFVQIEKVPLTPLGKIDRKVLETVEIPVRHPAGYESPANQNEKKLAEIWSEVLNIPAPGPGVTANFFELGGHSLKAVILLAKIHKVFNVKITLGELFQKPTIREMASHIRGAEENKFSAIQPTEKKEYYSLSPAQKRLYILQQMEAIGIVYNLPQVVQFETGINREQLETTINKLIQRHESLRTSFAMVENEPVQRVYDQAAFEIENYKIQNTNYKQPDSPDPSQSKVFPGGQGGRFFQKEPPLPPEAIIKNFIRPFDLTRAPLLRVGIIEVTGTKTLLLFDMHHIISDGFSHRILEQDFMDLYSGKTLPSLRLQYKDYTRWQESEKQKQNIKQQEAYWKKEFSGQIPQVNLPLDYARPMVQEFEGRVLEFTIPEADTQDLKSRASSQEVTLYMVIQAIFSVLLAKLSGTEEIVMGTAVAGRRHTDLEKIIGMFVNTLVLRSRPIGDKPFHVFLQEVKKTTLQAFENQDYPFEDLVEKMAIKRDAGRNPLFDIMFNYQSVNRETQPQTMPQLEKPRETGPERYESRISKFDLTLTAIDMENQLYFAVEYCTKLYKEGTIKRLIDYFKNIVSTLVRDHGQEISAIEILPDREKQKILYDFNQKKCVYPREKTLHGLYEEQVARTPDYIAAVSLPQKKNRAYMTTMTYISYGELNERANRLAHYLERQGAGKNHPVAIMTTPGPGMLTGILGILKAGCAYVPLNPRAPAARTRYMIKESHARILLTGARVSEDNPLIDNYIYLEESKNYTRKPGPPPGIRSGSNDLAYIIFTSGTTGRPKGVPITHGNISPLLHWGYCHLGIQGGQGALQNLPYYFDWSVWEIFITLTTGAKLYMVDWEMLLDPEACISFMNQEGIAILHVTPSQNRNFVQTGLSLETLKYFFIGAEKLTPDQVKGSYKMVNRQCRVFNMYGPTECTIIAAVLELQRTGEDRYKNLTSIPIGVPTGNTAAYILNKYNQIQPVNVAGQLWLAGDGVAQGYLNNPELTAEKFDHDLWDYRDYHDKEEPFGQIKNACGEGEAHELHELARTGSTSNQKLLRGVQGGGFLEKSHPGRRRQNLYKTGDLARWLPDGNIEFLGRGDRQVKIRGYRIELGEIEGRLIKHPDVKEAVVLAYENDPGDQYLCAYIIAEREQTALAVDGGELRAFLAKDLPDYMIPACFVVIDRIPLTPNGKIDVRRLPAPVFKPGEVHAAPRNETEEKLQEIWTRVLGKQTVIGIDDDFFEIGGNSLKAVQVVSAMREEFDITIDQIFQHPTIAELAPRLTRKKHHLLNRIQQARQDLEPEHTLDKTVKNLVQLLMKQHKAYKNRARQEVLPDLKEENQYQRILLTGGTGYLGIHLIYELIKRTRAGLYLLVRGQTPEEAEERIRKKCSYYFGDDFYEVNQDRLEILPGDIRKGGLGIPGNRYEELAGQIDAVVHAAANVRHFGRYEDFYETNVKATGNLLNFSLSEKKKDFHYISTMSVGACKIEGKKSNLFTEFCHDIGQQPVTVYVKSKLEAEKQVLDYRDRGLNAAIYRVGNLVGHSQTGKFQENIGDNAFYAGLKTYLALGMIPFGEESWADMTFIDQTAEAVALLLTRKGFINETFHLQNFTRLSLAKLAKFLREKGHKIELVTMAQFLDHLAAGIEREDNRVVIDRYLLHGGMLSDEKWETVNLLVSDRTQWILKKLGFQWQEVTGHHVAKMINHCRKVGFIEG